MIKVFEAFAGIGTVRMALDRLGIAHEVVGISEIDKFAIKSYEAIHGETKNYGDITEIDPKSLPDFDLFTYGFPCQDISSAGLGRGLDEGSGTRSSLLWECQEVIEEVRPKYLLMENVKMLVGKKHKPSFEKWLDILEGLGYTNYWQVLNAKDYGIPQNRERVFVVSIRKDVDNGYVFPEPLGCDNLDFRDYLSEDGFYLEPSDYDKVKGLGAKYSFGGVVKDNTSIYNTITASYGKVSGNSMKFSYHDKYRYLKPVECWRLMGISDEDFSKAEKVNSNTKLYKQAGNSIVVNVLEGIFTNLFYAKLIKKLDK